MGDGTFKNPKVGDLRIRYKVVENPLKKATVLGELKGQEVRIFHGPRGSELYHAFKGSYKDAVSTLRKEHNQTTWLFRILGFMLMWIGMMLIFGPISTFLDLIPLAGRLTRNVIAGISFLVSLILTMVTIIVSILVHNLWLMIGIVAAVAIGMIVFAKMKKNAKDRA
jgi:cellulose synthase/poly-beta-1,6-N-acetylglucosamine synthase-like glycosyltransferase